MGPTVALLNPEPLRTGFGAAALVAGPALLVPIVVRLLGPLRFLHIDWIDERLERLTMTLTRFRETPAALAGCFAGAIIVQLVLVAFYVAIAHSMRIPISFAELALIVPISFIVQMLPISMNGFGVREATFGFYSLASACRWNRRCSCHSSAPRSSWCSRSRVVPSIWPAFVKDRTRLRALRFSGKPAPRSVRLSCEGARFA